MTSPDLQNLFTRCLHHGSERLQPGDSFQPAIAPASIYFLPGEPTAAHQYGRWTNPTWSALEEALSILEDAATVIFPSGMAAIAAIVFSQLKAGDKILLPADGYYTTRVLAEKFLGPMGVKMDTCPTTAYDAFSFEGYRMVFVETPSNPGLDICNIRQVASRCRQRGVLVVVDNTTQTPLGQRPLDLGADIVVSSDTKAISGHSDALFGHVASRHASLMAQVREWRKLSGAIPGPFEAWLVHRGMETLEVRFERMCASTEIIAQRLAAHPKIQEVKFPGLPSHPAHATAKAQMLRHGFMIAVTLSNKDAAERFINECQFIRPATSFGGVHTSAERRARWGDQVPEGFVRLSVGCEPVETLWGEMKRVLDTV